MIVASHTDTHPPTDLHITEDGWAYITTTSNFDVYLHDHLHSQENHPEPLATLSARLEEALVIGELKESNQHTTQSIISTSLTQQQQQSSSTEKEENWNDFPVPLYRKMSIVCFDPSKPNVFHGGWTADEPENRSSQSEPSEKDKEVIQTTNDGIICISSSMSGAAQLCLPVHRSNKPILPQQSINGSGGGSGGERGGDEYTESEFISDHTLESISFSTINQLQLQQSQQSLQSTDQTSTHSTTSERIRNERHDSLVLSTGDQSKGGKNVVQTGGEGTKSNLIDSE